MNHSAIAIIPARGGSKRIPRKNLVNLDGKPLIAHSIISAKKSKYLDGEIYVSTDDKTIAAVAAKYGAKLIERPKKLASDTATTLAALKHAIKNLERNGVNFDTVVLLQATCPFRKVSTTDAGIKKLWDNWDKYKVIFSVRSSKFPPNWLLRIRDEKLEFILPNNFSKIRSQDLGQIYEIDGVLYVYKKEHLMNSRKYPFAENASGYILTDKIEAVDIDDPQDLEIAKAILRSKPQDERNN